MYKQKIEIIITGGTIDSYYEGSKDTVVPLRKSSLPNFIKGLKTNYSFFFHEVCMKDSRALTKEDIKKVVKIVNKTKNKNILITHGTYTMPATARFLAANLKKRDQVVILTGSMIPLFGFSPTDAGFNLGYSLASFSTLEPGVYVCMNGQIFTGKEVAKNIAAGKFVSIFNEN